MLDELGVTKGSNVSESCSYMGSSLHGGLLTCIWGFCVQKNWFWEEFLSPCGDFHYRKMSVFKAAPREGPKITAIRYWLSHFSGFYISCILDYEITIKKGLQFYVEERYCDTCFTRCFLLCFVMSFVVPAPTLWKHVAGIELKPSIYFIFIKH